MAIDNLKFAEYVDDQRKILIQKLKDKNVDVSNNATLIQAVNGVAEIKKEVIVQENGIEVVYYDIDGTILKTEYVEEGQAPTPPSNPSYDSEYLTFVKWAGLPETITESINVIADYEVKGEDTSYLFVECNQGTGLTLTMTFRKTIATFSADWGDGSEITTVTSASQTITHTYSEYGKYIITLTGVEQAGRMSSSYSAPFSVGATMIKKAYWSSNVVNGYYGYEMDGCKNLEVLIGPHFNQTPQNGSGSSLLNLFKLKTYILKGTSTFNIKNLLYEASSLKAIVFEKTSPYLSDQSFYRCYSLTKIKLPEGIHTIKTTSFNMDYPDNSSQVRNPISKLEYISLPSTLTTIESNVFTCTSVKKIIIPENVTSIATNAFQYSRNLEELIFKCKTNPGSCTFSYNVLRKIVYPSEATTSSVSISGRQLTDITLPQNPTDLGLVNNSGIEKLIIPRSITTMPSYFCLFDLKNIILLADSLDNLKFLNSNGFKYCYSLESIWVEDSILEDLKSATNWAAWGDYLKPISEMPEDL